MNRSAILGLILTTVGATQTFGISFHELGGLPNDPGGFLASAVSADGQTVVGESDAGASRWTLTEGIVPLGEVPDEGWSEAVAVSADGSVIVGNRFFGVTRTRLPFIWTKSGGMSALNDVVTGGPITGYAWDVSGDGSVVVGEVQNGPSSRAYRWTMVGQMAEILPTLPTDETRPTSIAYGVSDDGSVVVGESSTMSTPEYFRKAEAFRWTRGEGTQGLGYPNGPLDYWSTAYRVSADGSVAVGWNATPEGAEPVRWTSSTGMQTLGTLGGHRDGQALGVSPDGSTVVGYSASLSGDSAFIWRENTGMRSLKEVLTTDYGLDLSGWQLWEAVGVTNGGRVIVGNGVNPDGDLRAWRADLRPRHLVVVTHGWRPSNDTRISWIEDVKEDIVQRLKDKYAGAQVQGLTWQENQPIDPGTDTEWDVVAFRWPEGAFAGFDPLFPFRAPNQAGIEGARLGLRLGNEIANAGYDSVHFIGHSAGSWLINAATMAVKSLSPDTVVHETFLDAYAPGVMQQALGSMADWAEQYVNRSTVLSGDWPKTNETLLNAFNIEITSLLPSGTAGHEWPRVWYRRTTQATDPEDPQYYQWGFQKTLEWQGALPSFGQYPKGRLFFLETPTPAPPLLPVLTMTPLTIDSSSATVSSTGDVQFLDAHTFAMVTGSPVWLSTDVEVTEPVNTLEFTYSFLSDAEGSFSVFFDGQPVFEVEEAFAVRKSETQLVWLGDEFAAGTYTLEFLLETAGSPSSVQITDVGVGSFSVVLIPEPSAFALFAIGALALLTYSWRSRGR